MEYGAGKAGLSSFIAAAAGKGSKFILVDREPRRHKQDKLIKYLGLEVRRELMDIKDFDLEKFDEAKSVIGIAKHLCGGATDLALTSFMRIGKDRMKGLSIATCCHHRCDTQTYVNMTYVTEELGIKETEFVSFVTRSSYAVSPGDDASKRRAGFMVKRLLDLGRLIFINNSLGLQVKGVQYCDCATESPESTLIIGNKINK